MKKHLYREWTFSGKRLSCDKIQATTRTKLLTMNDIIIVLITIHTTDNGQQFYGQLHFELYERILFFSHILSLALSFPRRFNEFKLQNQF